MADDEQFSLCWNNFNSNLSAGFHESLLRGDLVDVTLAAEGQLVKAHRLILSVCSPYFRKMFTQVPVNQHAFIFLKDVSHSALKDLIQFMYCGEVNVKQDALPAFISTAEALQIKGLTESGDSVPANQSPAKEEIQAAVPVVAAVPTSTPAITQRSKVQRNRAQSFKVDSEESGDDKVQIRASSSHHVSTQQQQSQATVAASTQKRTMQQRNVASHASKRTKLSVSASSEGMDTSDTVPTQVQTVQIVKQIPAQVIEPEYIELPIESINPKNEPDYTDEPTEIETVDAETEQEHKLSEHDQGEADDDGNYVEDEAYGEMTITKYDETYLTEGEDNVKPGASGFVDSYTSDGGTGTEQSTQGLSSSSSSARRHQQHHKHHHHHDLITVSGVTNETVSVVATSRAPRPGMAIVKRNTSSQSSSFVKSKLAPGSSAIPTRSPVTSQSNNGGQRRVNKNVPTTGTATAVAKFIRSQKKCAQLVFEGYIYNRKIVQQNGRTTWRCSELLKYHCKATCVTKLNQLISIRRDHNHADHAGKIAKKLLYDFPEDLEEYMNIHTRHPIDVTNHEVDVIDDGADFKVVLRDQSSDSFPTDDTMLVKHGVTEMNLFEDDA